MYLKALMYLNLVLADITDDIIAMSFPGDSIEGLYRNAYVEVRR